MSFIRCLNGNTYEAIINEHSKDYLSFLTQVIEIAKHKLYKEQINDRWTWFISFASRDDSELREWDRFFTEQGIDRVKFFTDLKSWFLMKDPKINTFRLWGKANTGKSLVARCVTENFVTHYQAMCGAHSDFAMEGFLNVAIAMVEEAFFLPKEAEDWKQLMSGGSITVNKKYAPKQTITRTPVFVTSNHQMLGRGYLKRVDEKAFLTRMFDYNVHVEFKPRMTLTSGGFARYAKYILRCTENVPLPRMMKEALRRCQAADLEILVQKQILFQDH